MTSAEENVVEEYIKTTTVYLYDNVILSKDNEITAEEFNNATTSTNCAVENYPYCYETTYKRLYMATFIKDNKYETELMLVWKQVPVVTKYDNFAVRWTSSASLYSISGYQDATKNGTKVETEYTSSSSNVKTASNGAGITMNMYDNAKSHTMGMHVIWSTNPGTVYATYQHARNSAITKTNAMSYTFSANGLGGVTYFSNATIRGYYDGMQGLSSSSFPTLNT